MDMIALDDRLSADERGFIGKRSKLLIERKLVDAASGKTFSVYNTVTGTIPVQVAEADVVDVDRTIQAARRAFDKGRWPKMSPAP